MDDADYVQPRGKGLAITALILGIMGILIPIFVFAIAGLVCGIIALVQKQPKGLAVTAVVLSGIGIIFVPFIAIVAAIAIPNLLESRVTANEAAAAASLKSGIFPAEVQYQAAAACDQDGDGVGEYGFLGELRNAGFINGQLRTGDITFGYHFAVVLPDGANGVLREPLGARSPRKEAADAQERNFLVLAWPTNRDQGRRVFALGADGQVHAKTVTDVQQADAGFSYDTGPTWSTVVGADWSQSNWPVYSR